jgi:hypothetical protein
MKLGVTRVAQLPRSTPFNMTCWSYSVLEALRWKLISIGWVQL